MDTTREELRNFIQTKLMTAGRLGGDDEPIFTGGAADSLGIFELISFVEKRFQVKIDPRKHSLKEFDTIHSTLRLLEKVKQGHG